MNKALVVALSYLVTGLIWIFFSDALVFSLWGNLPEVMLLIQNYKGYAFVLLSSLLIYVFVKQMLNAENHGNKLIGLTESRLIKAQQVSKTGSWETDLITLSVYWSKETYRIFELDPAVFKPSHTSFLEYVHPDDKEKVDAAFKNSFTTREVNTIEHRIITANNNLKYVEENWQIMFDTAGKPLLAAGTCHDITERKKAEQTEYELHTRLKAIFDKTNDAIMLADDSGNYVQVNAAAAKMLGYTQQELTGKNAADIISKRESEELWNKFMQDGTQTGVIELVRKNGSLVICHYNATSNILPGLHLSILTDMTEQKKAERNVIESEKKYRLLFENNPLPMWMLQLPSYKIVDINDAAIKHYGYTRAEFLTMTARDLRPREDLGLFEKQAVEVEQQGTHRIDKLRHKKKNGELIIVDAVIQDIKSEGERLRIVLINDVTEKLQTQTQLAESYKEVHRLASHLLNIREQERTHIAREIHDELGQQLTAIKFDVAWVKRQLNKSDEKMQERLTALVSLIDHTVKTVRRISTELRPGVIDELGLAAALEWQSREFEKRTGILTKQRISTAVADVDKEIAINIFRVYQETLTNISRHAEATLVETVFEEKDGNLMLTVKDNGTGFDPEEVKNKKTLGITGMKERALLFDGELSIQSSKESGTLIQLMVPLQKQHV